MFRSNRPEAFLGKTPMPKCDFNKVALHGYSPVNLLHIFRTAFLRSTSGGLLLDVGLDPRSGQGFQFHSLFVDFSFALFSGYFAKAIQIFKGQPTKMP